MSQSATNHGMFAIVSDMNEAFGNPKGDPTHINWKRIASQCKNIAAEFAELQVSIARRDLEESRDALCDINVFSLGAHHLMGLDAKADLVNAIISATPLSQRAGLTSLGMFELVAEFNRSTGTPRGNPHEIRWDDLAGACKDVPAQHALLMSAIHGGDEIAVRRSLTTINILTLSAHHVIGFDAERDMTAVVEGVMTRFCRDEADLAATKAHFDGQGVEYYVCGSFPQVCLKSAKDQGDGEYPKDKFLKSVSYRKPVFPAAQAV